MSRFQTIAARLNRREAVILAALCFVPPLLAQKAIAFTLPQFFPTPCNGIGLGAFCEFLYHDPTLCQDCVELECDGSCGPDPELYYYCIETGFAYCLA